MLQIAEVFDLRDTLNFGNLFFQPCYRLRILLDQIFQLEKETAHRDKLYNTRLTSSH